MHLKNKKTEPVRNVFRCALERFQWMWPVAIMTLLAAACGSDNDDNQGGSSDTGTFFEETGPSTVDAIDTENVGFANLAAPFVISTFDTPEWDAGAVDKTMKIEGAGSLQWNQSKEGEECFVYGGTYCYLRLAPETPLDLSEYEFINMWIHNDTRSAYDTSYHETYYEPVIDFFHFNLVYEGGSYEALIRLDFEGWRQFSFEKRLFNGSENADGWKAITGVDMFVRDVYVPITKRTIHLDYLTASALPPGNVPARWLATFESGSYDPDIGSRLVLGQHVYDEDNGISQYHLEYTTIVDNPVPSPLNPSAKVFKSYVPQEGYIRAEYETSPMETDEKTYIYAWKEYLPSATFDNIDYHFLALGQWKTYPCEEMVAPWGDLICGGGGIFNDRGLQTGDPDHIGVRYRAEPGCFESIHTYETDVWTSYTLEIYWTNTENGYYRLYQNGIVIDEMTDIKTLFDRFPIDGTCDMKWALGVYSRWWSANAGTEDITYYLDDMAVFDQDHGVGIEDVLHWQQQ